MDSASDATARSQMMRRGIYSQFATSRGYSYAQEDAGQKSETLG
jgi:hypothetical protein